MEFLTVMIKTLSPVVLTAMNNATVMTESRDFISGSTLRGVLATQYVQKHQLGGQAQKDAMFRKLFFGNLRFVDAYPVKGGIRSFVLPFSLQKAKIAENKEKHGEALLDILCENPKPGYKPVSGFGVAKGNQITKVTVQKQVKLHMSRSGEKERLSGRSLDGGIYNYEAIEAGQYFQGVVIGSREELTQLLEGLGLPDKKMDCRIGRSKYTEYGHCSLAFSDIQEIPKATASGKELFLRLETAWLPTMGVALSADSLLEEFADKVRKELKMEDIRIGKRIAKTENVANFVGIWGLKRPEQQALAAGSVFSLYKESGWSENDVTALEKVLYCGQGARVEEGFGQLRVWDVKAPLLADCEPEAAGRKQVSSKKAGEIVANILMRRLLTRVKLQAEQDVRQLKGKVDEANHSFARLETLLGERVDLAGAKIRFQEKLERELRDQSILDKRLQNLTFKGKELKEILTGKVSMPYADLDYTEEIPKELVEDAAFRLPSVEDGAVFYEYWLWFFRHGRKLAIARKGDK